MVIGWYNLIKELFKNGRFRDFPDGSVAKTPHSQCRDPEFDPWLGNWIHRPQLKILHAATNIWCSQKKKKKSGRFILALLMIQRFYLKIWFLIIWRNRLRSHVVICVKWEKYQASFRGELNCGMKSVYNKGQFLLCLLQVRSFRMLSCV